MQKIVLFGECMLELRGIASDTMKKSFAGDVYNTGVYLKRAFPQHEVLFMSAVGQDPISQQLSQSCQDEGIGTDLLFKDEQLVPGIYLVQTDDKGERSFLYWRESSAARHAMKFVDEHVINTLSEADVFFFSGISLAVMEPNYRPAFWEMLKKMSGAGVKIVFDPNYRARLWASHEEAKGEFENAFALAHIAMPGIEDFQQLYGLVSVEQIQAFCQPFDIDELVIKNGSENLFIYEGSELKEVAVTSVKNLVDTTSAGDSFNGVYIGARLTEIDASASAVLASQAAGLVVQYPGAIIPAEAFKLKSIS